MKQSSRHNGFKIDPACLNNNYITEKLLFEFLIKNWKIPYFNSNNINSNQRIN